jgi:hypothetical protein
MDWRRNRVRFALGILLDHGRSHGNSSDGPLWRAIDSAIHGRGILRIGGIRDYRRVVATEVIAETLQTVGNIK